MVAITVVLASVTAYAVVGFIFALVFVTYGVARIDDAAESPTLGFRLMIFPGTAALWPILLTRWLSVRKGTTT
jgi:hypothetical protein